MILYETFRTFRGQALLLPQHQHRFNLACRELDLPPVDLGDFLPEDDGVSDVRVKVSVDISGEVKREFDTLPRFESVLWHEIWPVRTVDYRRPDPRTKFWREEVVALRELARRDGFSEVLLTDEDGFILEGSLSNVFFIQHGILITPHEGVLHGVFRHILIEKARNLGMDVQFRPISVGEWQEHPSGLFLSNSVRGMVATSSDPLPPLMLRLRDELDRDFLRILA